MYKSHSAIHVLPGPVFTYTDPIFSENELALNRYNVLAPSYPTASPGWTKTDDGVYDLSTINLFNHHFNLGFEPFNAIQIYASGGTRMVAGFPPIGIPTTVGTVGMGIPTFAGYWNWNGIDERTGENFGFQIPLYYDATNGNVTSFSFEVTAARFYEYRDSAGLNPRYDISTGAPL